MEMGLSLTPENFQKLSHENEKAVSPFYQKNIFDRKWMWDTLWVSYIGFLSNIFFMIYIFYDKVDLGFFLFSFYETFIT